MELIACSITLNVDETGTLDYGQKDHNNLVLNTLEAHLVPLQHAILQTTPESDDIISLDDNNSEMDMMYQRNLNVTNRELTQPPTLPSNDNNTINNYQPSQTFFTLATHQQLQTNYTSHNNVLHSDIQHVPVT